MIDGLEQVGMTFDEACCMKVAIESDKDNGIFAVTAMNKIDVNPFTDSGWILSVAYQDMRNGTRYGPVHRSKPNYVRGPQTWAIVKEQLLSKARKYRERYEKGGE